MTSVETATLIESATDWCTETRAILVSIRRLVEYFGAESEFISVSEHIDYAEQFLAGVVPVLGDRSFTLEIGNGPRSAFSCARITAQAISPLLQVIVEPLPEFVENARASLSKDHFGAFVRYYGVFIGTVDSAICEPVWGSFSDLAPEGWLSG